MTKSLRDKLAEIIDQRGVERGNDVLIDHAVDEILSVIREEMPKKKNFTDKFYGKSEIEAGFEESYNQAIYDMLEKLK